VKLLKKYNTVCTIFLIDNTYNGVIKYASINRRFWMFGGGEEVDYADIV
jgi:hypothetical protein